jgi:TonB family protein
MSSIPAPAEHYPPSRNRRLSARRRFDQLVYVDLGRKNGGMLVNVSEGGVHFQSIQPLEKDQFVAMEFMLPGVGTPLEIIGEVAWLDELGKSGGLRFASLPEDMKQLVRAWLTRETIHQESVGATEVKPESAEPAAQQPVPTIQVVPRQGPRAVAAGPTEIQPRPRTPLPAEIIAPAAGPVAPPVIPAALSHRHGAVGADRLAVESRRASMTPARLPDAEPSARAAAKPLPARAPRRIPATFIVACGCFVLLAVIAALLFFYTNFGRASSSAVANSPASAGTATQSTSAPAANAPASTFQIEVVESNNKRWALTDAGNGGPAPATRTPVRDLTARRPAPETKKSTSADPRPWPVQRLRVPQRAATSGNPPQQDLGGALSAPGVPAMSPATVPASVLNSSNGIPRPPEPAPSSPSLASISALQAPVLIKRVEPRYPPQARPIHLEGAVQVSTTIGTDGVPRALKIISGNPLFGAAAIDAISEWRFKPALLHGSPVEQPLIVTVTFHFKE